MQITGINSYKPRQPFIEFHSRPQRYAVLVCHRRAGKTVACICELVLAALVSRKQDARFAYICPLHNQAKDVAWIYLKRYTSDIPNVKYNESELYVELPNNNRIRLYGADNPDRMRGLYLDGVILDEYADMRPSVWGEVIRPALTDRKGWAVFIGTPKGHNDFYDLWMRTIELPNWFRLMLKASESGLVDAAELEAARAEQTEDQYNQEFECSFDAAVQGSYYGKLLQELVADGRYTDVEYSPEHPVYCAFDIGYSDDTAIWFYQIICHEIRIIDYYAQFGEDVRHYATVLTERGYNYAKLGNNNLIYLPHDAKQKTMAAAGKSIRQQFAELGYSSVIVPDLSLQDGIQAARLTLPKCYFDKTKCKDGFNALTLYRREYDSIRKVYKDRPLHDWTSHPADAFRYLAIGWREEQEKRKPPVPRFEMDLSINELIKRRTAKKYMEHDYD